MSPLRRSVLVAVLAVFGIALAAAITWATSQLVSQRIGLASQPLSAGRNLLPRGTRLTAPSTGSQPATTTSTSRGGRSPSTRTQSNPAPNSTTPTSTTPAVPSTTTPSAPSPANSGEQPSGRGEGGQSGEGRHSSSRRDD